MKKLPSKEEIRKYWSYDPKTGVLNPVCLGFSVYHLPGGYIQIRFNNGDQYLAHRLIYKLMTGKDPKHEIDHIDGDPSNNRWDNLRLATRSGNTRNARLSRRNKTGVKGVCWETSRRKWRASIGSDPRGLGLLWLKRFDTLKEAEEAIRHKRQELHGDFARHA